MLVCMLFTVYLHMETFRYTCSHSDTNMYPLYVYKVLEQCYYFLYFHFSPKFVFILVAYGMFLSR